MITFLASPIFTYLASAIILLCPAFLKNNHDKNSLQNLVISLGILGTFLGIFAGLQNFDTTNINSSIPSLLGGLKTAFLTSIAGSISALLIKITNIYKIDESSLSVEEKDESTLMLEELQLIRKSIAGDEDSSLVTQIQKLRTSQADKQDELKKAFDEFAKQMAENNMKALVEAVDQVMRDFNAKINDQLGQSFKELSESVRSLVEWQQNYILTVQQTTSALGDAQESLRISSESLNTTSEKISEIAAHNQSISEMNQELKVVIENLNQMLESTVGFSKNMKVLAESLNDSGNIIQSEIKSLVEESIKNMQAHADDLSKNINSIADSTMKNMVEKNTETLKKFEEINQKTLQDFGGNLASIAGKMVEDFRKVQEALSIK